MFSGWKLVNDMDILIQLKEGHFDFDFIDNQIRLNDQPYKSEFHMLEEISSWFDRDLVDNNIDKAKILKAELGVDFLTTIKDGKPKSRTKKIIEIKLEMKSCISTIKKDYLAEKEKTMEYHYIDPKKNGL
jgi:hypothetical protein